MGVYADAIGDVNIPVITKTELAGIPTSTSANDYVLPSATKKILYVQGYDYAELTVANQSIITSIKVESDDLGVKDYECYLPPISGITTVSASTISTGNFYSPPDLARTAIYPLMVATLGGEKMQFFGLLHSGVTSPTSSAFVGALIWWSDDPSTGEPLPYRAKITGTAGTGKSLTSTGTALGAVAGATITLAGQPLRTIRTLTGVLAGETPAAAKAIAGWFSLSAAEIAYIQRYPSEPLHAPGTSLTPNPAKLTRIDNLAVPLQPPSTIATQLFLTAAPTSAGNFGQGILYN